MSLLIAGNSMAQELPKNYAQLLEKVEPELIQWRRHFHQNPELSNREFNTGKYIVPALTYQMNDQSKLTIFPKMAS
jgi:amidohydrolase